jgi:hypothetical protein
MSAYSNLVGMYSTYDNRTLPDEQIGWPVNYSPIPVHTVDGNTDYVCDICIYIFEYILQLLNTQAECPVADAAQHAWYNSADVLKIEADHSVCYIC